MLTNEKEKNHKYDSSICSLGQEEASILKCVIFFTTLFQVNFHVDFATWKERVTNAFFR